MEGQYTDWSSSAQLYNEYHKLIVENLQLKTLARDLFQICVFEGVGQQTSQYDDTFKKAEEVLQNGKS